MLSSCNLTSFFAFSSFFFGNEFMCQRSLFLLGDNKHFFLLSTEVACLMFLLIFFSFRFDGVYFKVENIFFCQNVGKYDKRKSFYFHFSFLEANFDFLLISFFFYAACIKCSLMCSCSLFFLCLIFVVEIWICFVFFPCLFLGATFAIGRSTTATSAASTTCNFFWEN